MQKTNPNRGGFSIMELLVVTAIIAILLCLFLMNNRGSREAARRMGCSNHFKQIGLALHNYHYAHKHLPVAMWGGDTGTDPFRGNLNRLSGIVTLLPYLEQQPLWEKLSGVVRIEGGFAPAFGPAPWITQYEPWTTEIQTLRCPSDPSRKSKFGRTNYAFSIGDTLRQIHTTEKQRGMFNCTVPTKFSDIKDGLSNSVAMCEIGTENARKIIGQVSMAQPQRILDLPRLCLEVKDSDLPSQIANGTPLVADGRGGRWADGAAPYSLVQTVLPPGSPSCSIGTSETDDGVFSSGSYHQGGAHVLFGDGAVIFITESMDAGGDLPEYSETDEELAERGIYRFGLWGCLGTIAGNEFIEEALNQ